MEAVVQRWGNDFSIRKGWAKAFQKAKKKEKMLIPQTIVNSDFEWEW